MTDYIADISFGNGTRDAIKRWTGSLEDDIVAVRRYKLNVNGIGVVNIISFGNRLSDFYNWRGGNNRFVLGVDNIPLPDAIVNIANGDATRDLILNWVGRDDNIVAVRTYYRVEISNQTKAFPGFPDPANMGVTVLGIGADDEQDVSLLPIDLIAQNIFGLVEVTYPAQSLITKFVTEPQAIEAFLANPQVFATNFGNALSVNFTQAELTALVNAAQQRPDAIRQTFPA